MEGMQDIEKFSSGGELQQLVCERYRECVVPVCETNEETKLPDLHTIFNILRKLAPYSWPKGQTWLRIRLVAAFLIMLCGRLVNLLLPCLYKILVDSLRTQSHEHHRDNHDYFQETTKYPTLPFLGFLLLQLLVRVLPEYRLFLSVPTINFIQRSIEVDTFKRLHRLGFNWHVKQNTGKTTRIMSKGQDAIGQLIEILFFEFLPSALDILLVFLFLSFYAGIGIGVIAFIGITIYVIWTIFLTDCHRRVRMDMNTTEGEAHAIAVDSLLNFEAVKGFVKEKHEKQRYDKALEKYYEEVTRSQNWSILITVGQATCAITTLGAIMSSLLMNAVEKSMTIGDVVAINAYLISVWTPLDKLAKLWRTISRNFTNLATLFELMETPVDIRDCPDAHALHHKGGEIEFRKVSFTYEPVESERIDIDSTDDEDIQLKDAIGREASRSISDGPKYILKDVSFTIKPSQVVAIVGPSGGGKSTLSKLISRYYDPTRGQIFIDGQDIRDVTQKSLRKRIGVVPQDTILFNETIQYNVGYGSPLSQAPHEEVEEAVSLSQLQSLVESNPEGYATKVGERGTRLSGGERQRMAIARIFMKDPPILILDEATSSLDSKTEQAIQKSFQELSKGRTTLIIAHRLSTIINADCILVLKDGRIVEKGTHSELVHSNGEYSAMWQAQNQEN